MTTAADTTATVEARAFKDAVDVLDGSMNSLKGAVDVLDGSLNALELDDEKRHDEDFDAFASNSSLQASAALEATPVSHDPTADLNEEVEAEKDPEIVVKIKEGETNAPGDNAATSPPTNDAHVKDRTRYVTPKDFELLKVIGMGAFGKVLQVRNKQSKQIVAMKVISKRLLKRKSGYIENIQAERDIMTKIRHPFVVTMHCSFQTRDKLFIIMDFLAGGELFLRLGREGIFLEKQAAFYLGEIILALDHLHTHNILHRDLKPENILLSSEGHVCLTDFGLAKDFTDGGGFRNEEDESKARTICGTQEYMSPEMIARRGYGRASDYWSLGCIAYEMLSGLPPFISKQGSKDLFRKIMSERVKMPPGSSAAACKLLKGLLNRNVTARLGASRGTMFEIGGVAGLKQMEFFKGIDWEKLEQMEIDPPHKLHVDNDEDLRHFHDEFTKMPLPRSVTEMSMEHAQPRRCESDVFRGFSFVQQDWEMPHRKSDEVERYWTHMEEDGESLSECASSKMGLAEAQKEPEVPLKKKRPPRKRKKKNKGAGVSPMPSENGDATPAKPKSDDGLANAATETKNDAVSPLKVSDPVEARNNEAPAVAPTVASPVNTMQEAPKPKPTPPKPKIEEWQSVSASGKKKATKQSPAPTLVSRGNASLRNARPAIAQGGWGANSSPVIAQAQQASRSPAPLQQQQSYRPVPGSWAAKTSSPSNSVGLLNQSSTRTPQQQSAAAQQNWSNAQTMSPSRTPPTVPASPSSDWRKHKRVIHTSQLPPPPLASETQSWPSLGDFPTMNGATPSTTTKAKATTTPQGAWGKKR